MDGIVWEIFKVHADFALEVWVSRSIYLYASFVRFRVVLLAICWRTHCTVTVFYPRIQIWAGDRGVRFAGGTMMARL